MDGTMIKLIFLIISMILLIVAAIMGKLVAYFLIAITVVFVLHITAPDDKDEKKGSAK